MTIAVRSRRLRVVAWACLSHLIPLGVAAGQSPAGMPAPFGLNIDVDFNLPGEAGTGTPAATYPAAAGQAGAWSSVSWGNGPYALVGLDGSPTAATISRNQVPALFTFDTGATGDYARLVYDADRIDATAVDYTITGLPAGTYVVYTYAAAPGFGTVATRITIAGSAQTVAAAPTNFTFLEGATHARHTLNHPGGPLVIRAERAAINGVVNGFQIVPMIAPPPARFALLNPPDGAQGVSLTPVFSWEASEHAASYDVVIDTDDSFASPHVLAQSTSQTTMTVQPGVLAEGSRYFWRVVARNNAGATPGVPDPASFTTASAPPPPPQTFGLNIDIDFNFPGEAGTGVPAPAYAAASGQAGVWSGVSFGSGPFALVGLDGQPTNASISRGIVPPLFTFDTGATGDYARLVYDADRVDGPYSFIINGLPAGAYSIYTYAAAPGFATIATRITVMGEARVVASAPTDFTFAEGATHARHSIVHPGGPITILVDKAGINGVVNGFQIVPAPATASAAITSPATCTILRGRVDIVGVATAPGLTNWILEYTGGNASTWIPIAMSNTPVAGGTLAQWNTAGLRPCGYTLRLRVSGSGGTIETMRSFVLAAEGDANLDGFVDFRDLTLVITNFGLTGP